MAGSPSKGIPRSIARDGWWLSTPVDAGGAGGSEPLRTDDVTYPTAWHFMIVMALLVLADWLFWRKALGLSLALFAPALVLGLLMALERAATLRDVIIGGIIIVFSLLPVIEYVQPLSLLFYVVGLATFAVWIGFKGELRGQQFLLAVVRFIGCAPLQTVHDIKVSSKMTIRDQDWAARGRSLVLAWALPLLVGSAFVALLIAGNPLMEEWTQTLPPLFGGIEVDIGRLSFWIVMIVVVWPFMLTHGMRRRLLSPRQSDASVSFGQTPAIVNAISVLNSLVLFNLIFALQTGLDLAYLWAGAALPEGMTYAQYAHRGAYPLVATAILAAAFALISRPFARKRAWLRLMLALWIGQNLLLVVSSLYRLDLYAAVYGLTYWRVAAFIWMGLVAIGLVLIGWQIARDKTNIWLLRRNLVLLTATLYACCFVNFAELIADYNLALAKGNGGLSKLDSSYICDLGPTARRAILDFEMHTGTDICPGVRLHSLLPELGWRGWGLRWWRTQ